jgi:hypothetical protein
MNTPHAVLKSRPRIKVSLNRDSVSMGDDCASHARTVEIDSFVDPAVLAGELSSGYLPGVAGIGHTWTCVLNGVKIAEIATFGIRALVRESPLSEENQAYFVFHSATY